MILIYISRTPHLIPISLPLTAFVLTPKLIVDREYTPAQRRVIDARLAESLEQAKRGETYGPFEIHEDMTTFLHGEAKKARSKKTTSVKPSAR